MSTNYVIAIRTFYMQGQTKPFIPCFKNKSKTDYLPSVFLFVLRQAHKMHVLCVTALTLSLLFPFAIFINANENFNSVSNDSKNFVSIVFIMCEL